MGYDNRNTERLVRIESKLTRLMMEHGLNASGQRVGPPLCNTVQVPANAFDEALEVLELCLDFLDTNAHTDTEIALFNRVTKLLDTDLGTFYGPS